MRPKPREGLEPDDRFNTDFPVTRILPAYARQDLADPDWMRHVDVRNADWSTVQPFQLSMTSPPYMTKHDHKQNPLSGYQTLDGNYARYLTDLHDIYRGIAGRAAGPDAHLVVNVANLHGTSNIPTIISMTCGPFP